MFNYSIRIFGHVEWWNLRPFLSYYFYFSVLKIINSSEQKRNIIVAFAVTLCRCAKMASYFLIILNIVVLSYQQISIIINKSIFIQETLIKNIYYEGHGGTTGLVGLKSHLELNIFISTFWQDRACS